jgi:two-component system response regulator NreC
MPKLRILIADDHAMLREGLALLIDAQGDMEIIAQARSGQEAVEAARLQRPDIALLDVSMPDLGGAEAAERILRQDPTIRVVALTRHADHGYLRRMLRAGASGYVLKKNAADALIGALRNVAAGGTWIDPCLAGAVASRWARGPDTLTASQRGTAELSEREEQVLRLIAWGQSNKEVAAHLKLSIKTVEFYKAAALEKLQLRTRSDILRHALAQQWLSDESDPL